METRTLTTIIVDRREFERAASEFYGRQWRFLGQRTRGEALNMWVGNGGVIMPPYRQREYDRFIDGHIAQFPNVLTTASKMCEAGLIQPGFYSIEF